MVLSILRFLNLRITYISGINHDSKVLSKATAGDKSFSEISKYYCYIQRLYIQNNGKVYSCVNGDNFYVICTCVSPGKL